MRRQLARARMSVGALVAVATLAFTFIVQTAIFAHYIGGINARVNDLRDTTNTLLRLQLEQGKRAER